MPHDLATTNGQTAMMYAGEREMFAPFQDHIGERDLTDITAHLRK